MDPVTIILVTFLGSAGIAVVIQSKRYFSKRKKIKLHREKAGKKEDKLENTVKDSVFIKKVKPKKSGKESNPITKKASQEGEKIDEKEEDQEKSIRVTKPPKIKLKSTKPVKPPTKKSKHEKDIDHIDSEDERDQFPEDVLEEDSEKNKLEEDKEYREPLFSVSNIVQAEEGYYPIFELPLKETLVLQPNVGRSNTIGVIEKRLKNSLLKRYGKKIYTDKHLIYSGASHDFEPDIIWREENKELWLDIEIDEPYDLVTKDPTHYIGSYDTDRDNYFTREGWVVLRFAEEQIVYQQKSVIKYIVGIIDQLCGTKYSDNYNDIEDLRLVKRWTEEEAKQMASKNYREKYLNRKPKKPVQKKKKAAETDPGIEKPKPKKKAQPKAVETRKTSLSELTEREKDNKKIIENSINENRSIILSYKGQPPILVDPKGFTMNRSRAILDGFDHINNIENKFRLNDIEVESSSIKPILLSLEFDVQGQHAKSWKDKDYYFEYSFNMGFAKDNQLFVRIGYRNAEGITRTRTLSYFDVSPEFGFTDLYIKGYCHFRGEYRTFNSSRIFKLEILNHSWNDWPEPPDEEDL